MGGFGKTEVTKDPKFLDEIRKLPCIVCGSPAPNTVSHIKTVGSGGGDDWFNVTPKCGGCHTEWEASAPAKFCRKYPHFWRYLKSLGWYFDAFKKLRHPNLEQGRERPFEL